MEAAPANIDDQPWPGTPRWWSEREARLRRRRPRADGLTIERILAEALALVDGQGLDALTVRALAARLGTSSASLYRHVASREELLVLLVDEVIGEVRLPDRSRPGREKVVYLSTELRRVLQRHPNVVPALRAAPLLGPNALRGADCGLANLLDSGYPPDQAVPAYLALIDYVLGSVFFDTATSRVAADDVGDAVDAAGSAAVPTLWEHRSRIDRSASSATFSFGLAAFLDGLEAQARARAEADNDADDGTSDGPPSEASTDR